MTYSTIYDMTTGCLITDGVQSQKVCDATIQTARRIAADRGHSVIVEDRGTEECYRVTPSGKIWRAPKGWTPEWVQEC
jgi:streptogramin lyase